MQMWNKREAPQQFSPAADIVPVQQQPAAQVVSVPSDARTSSQQRTVEQVSHRSA